jgi:hypothetical protein
LYRLRAFENKFLRSISVGRWRKLYIKEFHNLYFSPNIARITRRLMESNKCSSLIEFEKRNHNKIVEI